MADEIIKENPDNEEQNHEKEMSVEEKLQQLMIDNAKLKKAIDKASSEAADYKKKYRETLSEKELASQEKADKEAEREEQFQKLIKENAINKLEKQFLTLEYSPDQALKAATAQFEGDTDTLFKVQKEVQDSKVKKAQEEWLRSRPEIKDSSNGDGIDPDIKAFRDAFGLK